MLTRKMLTRRQSADPRLATDRLAPPQRWGADAMNSTTKVVDIPTRRTRTGELPSRKNETASGVADAVVFAIGERA
jgi:hypothetical protein